MLRITLIRESEPPVLKLEGKLSGPWVNELEHTWRGFLKEEGPARLMTVDLSDVTFVSSEGQKLLKSMWQQGADLQGRSLMTRFIIEQIKNGSNGNRPTTHGGDNGVAA
jgi:anti-anti-sigma regulatory factor